MRQFVISITIALAISGCGAATTSPAPVATQAPSMATVAATSNLPALAAQYTAIADAANTKLDQCRKDLTAAGNDLTKAKAAVAECLSAENQYETSLGAAKWGSVQSQVNNVIKALGGEQVVFKQMASANSTTAFISASNQLAAAAGTLLGAVNVLRSALGLPPSQ